MAESSKCCNFRKHMQIEKAPANQENIINLTAGAANAHNTNKHITAFAVRFFIWLFCEHLQCMCCQINEDVFLICRCFSIAARWVLSATVVLSLAALTSTEHYLESQPQRRQESSGFIYCILRCCHTDLI